MLNRILVAASAALMLALVFFVPRARAADPDCGLLQDCQMDDFYGDSGAGSGAWKIFKLQGPVGIDEAQDAWPRPPSVHLHGDHSPFDAGIFQRVNVTPGLGYHFDLAWAVEQLDGKGWQEGYGVNRRLGIDPFGGTDPNAGTVKWSSDYYGKGKFELQMDEYARASTITVFIRVQNPYADKVVDVYLDTASLKVNTSMPPISISQASPTMPPTTVAPTRAPTTLVPTRAATSSVSSTPRPTRTVTNTRVRPTATSAPTEVPPTETMVALLEPSSTSTPTFSATVTVQPSATTKPSATSRPSRVRATTPTPVAETTLSVSPIALGLGGLGLLGVVFAGVLFSLAFYHWRRSNQ